MEYRVIYRRNDVRNGVDVRNEDQARRAAERLSSESGVTDVVWGRS